jgi:hypothetical protein
MILKIWATPGNHGRNGIESKDTQVIYVYFGYGFALTVSLIWMAQYVRTYEARNSHSGHMVLPGDFAIRVKNLPRDATDEGEIMDFFRNKGLVDDRAEIVQVIIGWDAKDVRVMLKREEKLWHKLIAIKRKDRTSEKLQLIRDNLHLLKREISDTIVHRQEALRSSGNVVVTFRNVEDQLRCRARWNNFWARWLRRDTWDCCCFRGACPGTPLPRFQKCNNFLIRAAPNPGDINWTDLGQDCKWVRFLISYTLIIALICASVFAILLIKSGERNWIENARVEGLERIDESEEAQQAFELGLNLVSFIPGLAVSAFNFVLRFICPFMTEIELHGTFTSKSFSTTLKMAMALFSNTSLAIFIVSMLQVEVGDIP